MNELGKNCDAPDLNILRGLLTVFTLRYTLRNIFRNLWATLHLYRAYRPLEQHYSDVNKPFGLHTILSPWSIEKVGALLRPASLLCRPPDSPKHPTHELSSVAISFDVLIAACVHCTCEV